MSHPAASTATRAVCLARSYGEDSSRVGRLPASRLCQDRPSARACSFPTADSGTSGSRMSRSNRSAWAPRAASSATLPSLWACRTSQSSALVTSRMGAPYPLTFHSSPAADLPRLLVRGRSAAPWLRRAPGRSRVPHRNDRPAPPCYGDARRRGRGGPPGRIPPRLYPGRTFLSRETARRRPSRCEDDLDAVVLLLLEHLVHVRRLLERDPVRGE